MYEDTPRGGCLKELQHIFKGDILELIYCIFRFVGIREEQHQANKIKKRKCYLVVWQLKHRLATI